MSAPFVTQLRTRGDVIRVAPANVTSPITVRVEMPEVWDTVSIAAAPDDSVMTMKMAALDALYPSGRVQAAFVLKLRGFEVLDEEGTLERVGAEDGSIFLLTHRRRRPVR